MKIFLLSFLSFYCLNKSECNIDFNEINIKYFELTTSIKDYNFADKAKFKKTIISNNTYIIEFHEEIQILSSRKDVFYVLRFENNLLEGYTFKIPVEQNKTGIEFYYNVLRKIDKTKNDFIKDDEQLSYMKTTKNCKRFFRFTGNEIFGGYINLSQDSSVKSVW